MQLLAFVAAIASAATAAMLESGPTPTPKPALHRRQSATSTSSFRPTQTFAQTTYAFYSGGESDGAILWAPITYATETWKWTSSGDFFRACSSSYDTSSSTFLSLRESDCPMWTTCSLGYLVAASTSAYCVQQGYSCYTELLYSSYGATDRLSWLYCGTTGPDASNTHYYRKEPAATVRPLTTDISTTELPTSTTTSSSSSSVPTSESTSSTSPSPTPPPSTPPKSNNAPIIAGSVVGGVAVIAIAAVAIFFILRRNRNNNNNHDNNLPPPATPAPDYYQADKPQPYAQVYDQGANAPEYNPHGSAMYSMGSTSPTVHSPQPQYAPIRNELAA